jgi:ADP-ribose pyrophosphatase YjhB (NUDIX family)
MKEQHKYSISTVDIIIEKDSRILLIKRKRESVYDRISIIGYK